MSLIHQWPLIDGLKDTVGVSSIRTGTANVTASGKLGTCFKSSSPGVQTSVQLVNE